MSRDLFPQLRPLWKATFVDRPNRFLMRCRSPELGLIEAHLPNPGRMWELLLPGVTVHITAPRARAGQTRRTQYTAVAVERNGAPIFLDTHLTNAVARFLVEDGRVPGLKRAKVVRAEVPVGHSRFDFLLRDGRGDIFLEVKSCTLFGNGVAMFPDAVTDRGRRHLVELAEMTRTGVRAAVLFVVHSPDVDCFMPDYHTDPAFTQALLSVRKSVKILPMTVQWTPDLHLGDHTELLPIPWSFVKKQATDRGSYLVVLELGEEKTIDVGKLGSRTFPAGYYVYVGSAMGGLAARIARHRRKIKKMRWHIDYLRRGATAFEAIPIRSSARIECDLAKAVGAVLTPGPKGFGSSDCQCATHLFHSKEHPLRRRDFHSVVEGFRMRRPDEG